jgi:hypothetical protein
MPIEGSITPSGAVPVAKTPQVYKISESSAPPIREETPPDRGDQKPVLTPDAKAAAAVAETAKPAEPAKAAEPAKPEGEPAKPEEPKELESWRVAALVQKDKAIRERAEAAKKMEAALAEREAKLKEQEEIRSNKDKAFRANPLLALKELGWDYNNLSEFVAKGGFTPEQLQALELQGIKEQVKTTQEMLVAQRQALEEQRAADLKAMEEREVASRTAEEQRAVQDFQNDIKQVIEASPEEFELLNQARDASVRAIFSRIEKHYETTGKQLSVKDAAAAEEKLIFEQLQKIVAGSKKFAAAAPAPGQRRAPSPTLSNKGTVVPAATEGQGRETEAERRRRVANEIIAIREKLRG